MKRSTARKQKKSSLIAKIKRALTSPVGAATKQKEGFIQDFAMLINSGLDIITALKATRFELQSVRMQELIDQIVHDIDDGYPVWRAFKRVNLLPAYMLALVRVGEETGKLPRNLQIVVEQQRKNRQFRAKLVSAMIYPGIIFGLSIVIAIGIFVFVLPSLSNVYKALNIDLPFITRLMISTGNFLKQYGHIVIPLAVLCFFLLYYYLFVNSKTKHIGQRMVFSIPALRVIIRNIELARFGFTFSTLLDAGLPILDGIHSLQRSTEYYNYKGFYAYLEASIQDGLTFEDTFKSYSDSKKLFPISIQQIIISAEQSGKLVSSAQEIGITFEERIETSSRNLAVILEPVMLIIVWLGVVFVALSVIFPVYDLVGSVNQSTKVEAPTDDGPDTNSTLNTGSLRIQTFNGSVNVYENPNKNAKVLTAIEIEQTFPYTESGKGWFQIIYDSSNNAKGWIEDINAIIVVELNEQKTTDEENTGN